jgi:hypothetical protein
VEPIDANGQTCGIQQSTISNAIEYPLVGTGLTIDSKSDSYLSVATSTIIIRDNCVTAYSIELLTRLTVIFHEKLSRARVLLWESGGLFSSTRGDHAPHCDEVFRQAARDLVVSWNREKK